jgi:hypothetical protein
MSNTCAVAGASAVPESIAATIERATPRLAAAFTAKNAEFKLPIFTPEEQR